VHYITVFYARHIHSSYGTDRLARFRLKKSVEARSESGFRLGAT
jgi:hypothetical protein